MSHSCWYWLWRYWFFLCTFVALVPVLFWCVLVWWSFVLHVWLALLSAPMHWHWFWLFFFALMLCFWIAAEVTVAQVRRERGAPALQLCPTELQLCPTELRAAASTCTGRRRWQQRLQPTARPGKQAGLCMHLLSS